jgi:hypothetical protein
MTLPELLDEAPDPVRLAFGAGAPPSASSIPCFPWAENCFLVRGGQPPEAGEPAVADPGP